MDNVCPCNNGLDPELMTPEQIQDEINALLFDDDVNEACGAVDRELLTIVVARDKAHYFDFLQGKTNWLVTGRWKDEHGSYLVEDNVQFDVEFKDAKDESIGKRLIDLLRA